MRSSRVTMSCPEWFRVFLSSFVDSWSALYSIACTWPIKGSGMGLSQVDTDLANWSEGFRLAKGLAKDEKEQSLMYNLPPATESAELDDVW